MYCTHLITLRPFQHQSRPKINQGITHPRCHLLGVAYQSQVLLTKSYVASNNNYVLSTKTTWCLLRAMCCLLVLRAAYQELCCLPRLHVSYPSYVLSTRISCSLLKVMCCLPGLYVAYQEPDVVYQNHMLPTESYVLFSRTMCRLPELMMKLLDHKLARPAIF